MYPSKLYFVLCRTFNPNLFAVGSGDLDPLGRSDGGMLMNPRNIQPEYSGPGRLPFGAIPPGIF